MFLVSLMGLVNEEAELEQEDGVGDDGVVVVLGRAVEAEQEELVDPVDDEEVDGGDDVQDGHA